MSDLNLVENGIFPIIYNEHGDLINDKLDTGFNKQYFELKTKNRFLVEFPERFSIDKSLIIKINKPKLIQGKWENIKIEFIDAVSPSISQGLFKIIKYLKKNKLDNKKLFEIKLFSLNTIGAKIEEWIIDVEEVLMIDFGEVNYNSDEIQFLTLIVKPLDCRLNY